MHLYRIHVIESIIKLVGHLFLFIHFRLQSVMTKLQAARNEQKEKKEKAKEKKKKSKKKDDKKEKKRRSSGGEKEENTAAGESSSKTDPDNQETVSTATAAAESKEKAEAAMPSAEPSQSAQESKAGSTSAQAEPSQQTPASTDSVISLLPDTNDFLDEEIKMSESIKRVSANTVTSKPAKDKEPAPKTVEKLPERESPKQAATRISPQATAPRPQKRSPPVTVTMRVEDPRVHEVAPRGSVKSRLGIPAAKRKAEIEESPRVLTRMSTVVRVPVSAHIDKKCAVGYCSVLGVGGRDNCTGVLLACYKEHFEL